MARNIKDAFGALVATKKEAQPTSAPANPRGTIVPIAPTDPDLFEARMEDALTSGKHNTPLIGGTVELVGLDDVRRALGKTWASVAEKVGELAEAEVVASLGANDFYRPYGTSSFLIGFVGLQKSEAEKRAQQIATRIKSRLAQDYPSVAHEISPEPFVAVIEPDVFSDRSQPLVEKLVKHLLTLRHEMERSVSRLRSPLLRRSSLQFSPALHVTKRMTGYNTCILDSPVKDTMRDYLGLQLGGTEYRKTMAELDYITLTRSLRALYMMLKVGRVVPLLVPVTFQTVSGATSGQAYRRLLETMKPVHKSLLAVEIVDIPDHEHSQSVIEQVSGVAPLVSWLALQVDLDDWRIADLARAPLWALATDLEHRKSTEAALYKELRQFRAIALQAQLNTLAHGANSIGLALAAIETGVTYVDGPAILHKSKEPRTPTPFNPSMAFHYQNRISRRRR